MSLVVATSAVWADEATLTQVSSVRIVDAHGTVVGETIHPGLVSEYVFRVILRLGSDFVRLDVTTAGFTTPSSDPYSDGLVVYESPTCDSQPFFMSSDIDLPLTFFLAPVAISGPKHTLYIQVKGAPFETRNIAAIGLLDGGCRVFQSPEPMYVRPAVPVVDLLTLFTPPFRLEEGAGDVPYHVHRSVAAHQRPPNTGKRALTGPPLVLSPAVPDAK